MFPRRVRSRAHLKHHKKLTRLIRTSWIVIAVATMAAVFSAYVVYAAISVSNITAYTQSFDGMGIPASNPAPSNLPADFRVGTVSSVRNVGSFFTGSTQTSRVAGANMSTTAANGSYNFGDGTTSLGGADRAAGFLASGTATMSGNLYAELINGSGTDLTGLQISYNVEKYRNGSNPSGFRYQLYYSPDGLSWTSAGSDFLTSFAPDADNSGFATAPGESVSVNNTLNVAVASNAKIYLAWNYSVTSGTTTTNAPALGIDDVSILGIGGASSTNPSGVGSASPNVVEPGASTLLTVSVTPGSNPTSTAHAVTVDLSSIGGVSNQTFFDDGTNGDVTPNDNVFSFNATVSSDTTGGPKNLAFQVIELSPLARVGNGTISLLVPTPTSPSGLGAANPASVLPGDPSVLTVSVTPGSNPTSTGLMVTADLSTIGGSNSQLFYDDGVSGGDAVANDHIFTYTAIVAQDTTAGGKSLGFNVSDAEGRGGSGSIALNVQQPPPPVDHVVISQIYGGGGNSGATFSNDYIELYNPTGVSFDLAGWSLQYASATGTSWTNKQPLGGMIAPGEYFLVSLASGGSSGSALPASNIQGDINISATAGKVALVNNSVNLSGSCPNGIDPDIVDFVGYGSTASCFEGAGSAPAPSNSTAIFRKLNGLQDTNQNNSDFQTGVPNPRRTAPIVELGPWVASTDPTSDGFNAPYDATITVEFSEPVDISGTWFVINCTVSGLHSSASVASFNNFKGYQITPNTSFQFGEQCSVTINKDNVHDQDLDDSAPNTDTLPADYVWTFAVVGAGQPAPYPPSVHLTMGNPSNAVADLLQFDNYLMEKPTYSLSYNRDKGTPNWVSWHLTSEWFGSLARFDTFRPDPAVSPAWYRVQATDYSGSGFDRGHMTPNADRDNENRIPINQETYLMSNMVPQSPDNNQGPWAAFENYLRSILGSPPNEFELYIVSGPFGVGGSGSNGGLTETIANGHVTVPAATWKVVLVLPKGDDDVSRVTAATRTIAIQIPNVQGIRNNDWHDFLTTVDAIEAETGYDFFANIPDNIEHAIEAGTDGNNPPGTENQSASTAEDTPTNITLNAVSPLATPTFTYTIVSGPSNGGLSGTGPSFTYTPALNFHGTDSFTFKVNDGSLDSNTSTVNITVTAVNDAPSADSQSVTTNSNTPVNITLTGSDLETPAANLSFTVTVNPTHGTLSGTGANLTYSPALDYTGADSFKFTVTDAGDDTAAPLTSSEATVSITVNDTVNPTITAPPALNLGTGPGAIACALFISDATLGTATASDNSGVVSVARTGVPAGNLFPVGTTIVTYTATDGAGNMAQGTQSVTVFDNTPPTVSAPAPITVQADGNGQAVVPDFVSGTTASDNCSAVTISQSPAAGTVVGVGIYTITLTATDAVGNMNPVTTTLTVAKRTVTFDLSVSPSPAHLNSQVKIRVSIANYTGQRQSVWFEVSYTSPCGGASIDSVGPIPIQDGAESIRNIPFHIPKNGCTGVYMFKLDYYVGGQMMGTTTVPLTVLP